MGERFVRQKPESLASLDKWNKDQFDNYLLGLAMYGEEALLSIDDYPNKIELGLEWRTTLYKLDKETDDKHERYGVVGVKQDLRSLYLPKEFSRADKPDSPVSVEAIREQKEQAKRSGADNLVGDIHSHPKPSYLEKFQSRIVLLHQQRGFSPGDLYRLVHPRKFVYFMGLAAENEYFLAFRTQETDYINGNPSLLEMDKFEKHWYRKQGILLDNKRKAKILFPSTLDLFKMNLDIAHEYKLALYQGFAEKDLIRQYP